MKVKKLIKILSTMEPDYEIKIDADENGHYELENVLIDIDEDEEFFVNLISSSEI